MGRGLTVESLDSGAAMVLLVDFYANVRADDVDIDELGDMLFLERGTYDWHDGAGRRFEYSLRRQLFVADTPPEDADDRIWILELRCRYEPSDETEPIGSGSEGCSSPDNAHVFAAVVTEHPATAFVRSRPRQFDLRFGQDG